jgi:apolipoprotein D and lipocalin family protein
LTPPRKTAQLNSPIQAPISQNLFTGSKYSVMKKPLLIALLILCKISSSHAQNSSDNIRAEPSGGLTPIPSLDLKEYLGKWYEIAKYPNRFQKNCAGDTTAEYIKTPDGRIQVINRCKTEDGPFEEAKGVAKRIGESGSAKLKVRFAPAWLSFIPAVWGDYWVIDLDENYQLAAVSEPSRTYLWILSRTPSVRTSDYDALIARLKGRGFDIRKIVPTPQSER